MIHASWHVSSKPTTVAGDARENKRHADIPKRNQMTSIGIPVELICSRHAKVEEGMELEWREGSAYKGKDNALITTSNFSSATYRIEAYLRLQIHSSGADTANARYCVCVL